MTTTDGSHTSPETAKVEIYASPIYIMIRTGPASPLIWAAFGLAPGANQVLGGRTMGWWRDGYCPTPPGMAIDRGG